jgi:FAD/FMN-containing dehydrogenase
MIAADVHGKNHHRDGGFGDQVEELTLALPTARP